MFIRPFIFLFTASALLACGAREDTSTPRTTASPVGSNLPVAEPVKPLTPPNDPVAFAKAAQAAAIDQTVTSKNGVLYQIPVGWQVSEGPQQSNFRTPMLLGKDFGAIDFAMRGSVSRASVESVFGRTGVGAAEGIPQLMQSYASDFSLEAPSEIALPDGRKAQFGAYGSEQEMTALYLISVGEDDYLKVVLTVRDAGGLVDDSLSDYRNLFDRIAASAKAVPFAAPKN